MIPLYRKVKEHVLSHITSGKLQAGARVPSENDLVRDLGVSRMTVNRALREMTDDGILARIPGVGTFVADRTAHAHPLEVRNIADEIQERGHKYSARVYTTERVRASAELARNFTLPPGTELYHSLIVHCENEQPLQLEDRYVNPELAPGYIDVDFTRTTPYEYLIRVSPLQEAEHVLRSEMPSEAVREKLAMGRNEPCLLLLRRTWTDGIVASTARLYYPGSRYEMSGRFKP